MICVDLSLQVPSAGIENKVVRKFLQVQVQMFRHVGWVKNVWLSEPNAFVD